MIGRRLTWWFSTNGPWRSLVRWSRAYTKELKRILKAHGWAFFRTGNGDHEIWTHPDNAKKIVVDGRIISRHTANATLKQANIPKKF